MVPMDKKRVLQKFSLYYNIDHCPEFFVCFFNLLGQQCWSPDAMDVFHVKDGVGVAGSETRVSEGGQSYDNDYHIGDDAIWW